MDRKKEFFSHAAKANLTGEQLRVLLCLLAYEADGIMGPKQKDIAEELGMPNSNVSRSIKALIDSGLISKTIREGFDGRPVYQIDKAFQYGPVDSKYLV